MKLVCPETNCPQIEHLHTYEVLARFGVNCHSHIDKEVVKNLDGLYVMQPLERSGGKIRWNELICVQKIKLVYHSIDGTELYVITSSFTNLT